MCDALHCTAMHSFSKIMIMNMRLASPDRANMSLPPMFSSRKLVNSMLAVRDVPHYFSGGLHGDPTMFDIHCTLDRCQRIFQREEPSHHCHSLGNGLSFVRVWTTFLLKVADLQINAKYSKVKSETWRWRPQTWSWRPALMQETGDPDLSEQRSSLHSATALWILLIWRIAMLSKAPTLWQQTLI